MITQKNHLRYWLVFLVFLALGIPTAVELIQPAPTASNLYPRPEAAVIRSFFKADLSQTELFGVVRTITGWYDYSEVFADGKTEEDLYKAVANFPTVMNVTEEQRREMGMWSFFHSIRPLLTDQEWLTFIGEFKNNIFPLGEVSDQLPESAIEISRRCGAQYIQIVTREKAASILCFYILEADTTAEWEQYSYDQYIGEPEWRYDYTEFHHADYLGEIEGASFKYLRVGLPTQSVGPFPEKFHLAGRTTEWDGWVHEVVPGTPSKFGRMAEYFSAAQNEAVPAEAVQYVVVRPNTEDKELINQRYGNPDSFGEENVFTAEHNGKWMYFISYGRSHGDDYFYDFVLTYNSQCSVAGINVHNELVRDWVCISDTPLHITRQ